MLLLEAGPDYPEFDRLPDALKYGWGLINLVARAPDSPHNWAFVGTATPQQTEPMLVPRGKVVGGSSAINGQTFIRGAPEDFDTWASWGNDEWSYLKVLPYFRKLETDEDIQDDFHGTDGPMPVRRHKRDTWPPLQEAFYQACVAAGFPEHSDIHNPDSTGVSPRAENNIDGVRMSTALTYINPSRHRLNLTIRPNVLARRILFDGMRATGVEVESGGEIFAIEGVEIILSAGAVASPQLLMLSGVGPAGQLRSLGIQVVNDLPGVGQNMRDHPNVSVRFRVKEGLTTDDIARRAVRLRYTATGSNTPNDMVITPSSLNTVVRQGEDPNQSIGAGLYLAVGAGELRGDEPGPAPHRQAGSTGRRCLRGLITGQRRVVLHDGKRVGNRRRANGPIAAGPGLIQERLTATNQTRRLSVPIERLSPELDRLVSADQELEELGNGYEVAEGPLWWHKAGHLIFSEVSRDSPDQTNFPGYSSFWDTVKYNPAFQGRQMRPDSLKFPVFI